MNILVFNCGSSSFKYKLFDIEKEKTIAQGEAQRIGPKTIEPSTIIHFQNENRTDYTVEMDTHFQAFEEVIKILNSHNSLEINVISHRLVHGGVLFSMPTIITKSNLKKINKTKDLAPIHNPPAINLIEACFKQFPGTAQVAIFDTAFHQTIPEYAYTYALPKKIRETLHIRKYGFHGTSHQFVIEQAAKFLDIPLKKFNAISCHLGSGGASLCAVENGKSIDNTMGFSPLQGLVMSTRCGDLDPAVTLNLLHNANGNTKQIEDLLNKKSGVLGVSGFSADIRDILKNKNNDNNHKTLQIYLWRIKKYIGSYLALITKPDAIIFTDTIGETIPFIRWEVCNGLSFFGITMDPKKNDSLSTYPQDIAENSSAIRILVIKTDEELSIARQTYQIILNQQNKGSNQ